jgi:hypothetical protein
MNTDERRNINGWELTCECSSRTSPGVYTCGEPGDEIVEHTLLATGDRSDGSCIAKTLIISATALKWVRLITAWTRKWILTLIMALALLHSALH